MKKVLLFISGIILFLFISANVASAFSTSIAEAIQGLPFGEQLTLLAQRVDENTVKTQQLEQDLNTTKQQLEEEKAKNATLEAELVKSNASNQIKFNKQQACIKANELSQIPTDMQLRTAGESGGNGCGPSNTKFMPSSTQGALEYLQGWVKNYKDTGMQTWRHSPDVCLYDVERALPILEQRYTEYQNQKALCGS